MSSVFRDVEIDYLGKTYTIKSTRILDLICDIEEVITLNEVNMPKNPPLGKVAKGFARALRFAGCDVSDDEVYQEFFIKGHKSNGVVVCQMLLMIMCPPPDLIPTLEEFTKKKMGRVRTLSQEIQNL
jgi:hypothetical protein